MFVPHDGGGDQTALLAAISNEEVHALGRYTGTLSAERAQLMNYYLGKPFGNEEEGRSQVVSTDVADTIESLLPTMIKIFVGGDQIGTFNAISAEDEPAAKQETDFTNWMITEQNHSFVTFYSWFKDALLQKNGYVKYYWEVKDKNAKERYEGLTDDQLLMLSQDPQVTIIAHESYPDHEAMQQHLQSLPPGSPLPQQAPPMLHNVQVQITNPQGQVRIDPVPPEEVLVAARTRDVNIKEAPFVQHRTRKSISAIREMGYELDDQVSDENDQINNLEFLARHTPEESVFASTTVVGEGASREVLLKETWIRYDFDGDGIAELRRILQVGSTILENEETEEISLCCLSPVLMPHVHFGRSVGELVADIQLIKSTLLRQVFDNLYLQNSGRYAVDTSSNKVNLDDLLTSRIGGVIRVNGAPGEAIMPIEHPFVGAQSMNMMEYLQGVMENRTGVTRYNQGLDSNSLNKTATGIQNIMSAAQERMLLIARCFAETGVKDLFLSVHGLLRRHADKDLTQKVSGTWVTTNPREWRERTGMTVSVGLGTGNKQEQGAILQSIFGLQGQVAQHGLATPQNVYNTLAEITKNAGFRNPDKFFTDPTNAPPAPPAPPPPEVLKLQQEGQLRTQQMQLDKYKADQDAAVKLEVANLARETEAPAAGIGQDIATLVAQLASMHADLAGRVDAMAPPDPSTATPPQQPASAG
jgi:hypothetical protein